MGVKREGPSLARAERAGEARTTLAFVGSPRAGARLYPRTGLLLLPGRSEWLLLDAEGEVRARFAPELGEAFARSPAEPPPLLRTIARRDPLVREALAEDPLPLEPAAALRREGWGQLFVELTGRCNERCVHCYAEAAPERTEALDRATVSAVLREAAVLGFRSVQFTGGEALLWPSLARAAREARGLGFPCIEVYTNGVLLDAERYAALRAQGVAFAFSLYARDPGVHDAVTGLPGSHARTLAAIERALAGGSQVRVSVLSARPGDEAEARAAAELLHGIGVPPERVALSGTSAVGRGEHRPLHDPGSPAPHGLAAGGKAAVLYDGSVTPCIFARDRRLGRVGPRGGLTRALAEAGAGACGPGVLADLGERLRAASRRLACPGCRVAWALLEGVEARELPLAAPGNQDPARTKEGA